jgi:hypothetical protein
VTRSVRAGALTAADPFAWTFEGDESPPAPERLNGPRVTQSALARICGVCAEPLGRPVAFVGTHDEVGRNAFHAPPLHVACAEDVRARLEPSWTITLTGGFEFVRPSREDDDRRPTFQPNSLL